MDSHEVCPPRFETCRSPGEVHKLLNIEFPKLHRSDLGPEDWTGFVRRVDDKVRELLEKGTIEKKGVSRLMPLIRGGDLRLLDSLATARNGDLLTHSIEMACSLLEEDQSGIEFLE